MAKVYATISRILYMQNQHWLRIYAMFRLFLAIFGSFWIDQRKTKNWPTHEIYATQSISLRLDEKKNVYQINVVMKSIGMNEQ